MINPQPPLTPEELAQFALALLGRTMPDNFRVMVEALFRQIEWQNERLATTERLLLSVLTDVDDDFDGFSSVRLDIAKFLGKDPAPWL